VLVYFYRNLIHDVHLGENYCCDLCKYDFSVTVEFQYCSERKKTIFFDLLTLNTANNNTAAVTSPDTT